jgi:hypothetical protein
MPQEREWTITLNKYQRNNLLWLLKSIGWNNSSSTRAPLISLLNTGDWVGEIGFMLDYPSGEKDPDQNMIEHSAERFARDFKDQVRHFKISNRGKRRLP